MTIERGLRLAAGVVVLAGFIAGVIVLLLWLGGWFSPKIAETAAPGPSRPSDFPGTIVRVRLSPQVLSESAMGTVHAVHETSIGSKLLARVMAVNLTAGQKVQAGDVLVRLDDGDLRARLEQSKAAVASLEAARARRPTTPAAPVSCSP